MPRQDPYREVGANMNKHTPPDKEFSCLFMKLPESRCDKKHTASGTYSKGFFYHATNFCEHEGETCPRLNMSSGVGYELCKAHHAEANLAEDFIKLGIRSDGIAWLVGHYWICEPCATALKSIGVKEIRIMESAAGSEGK
jgi:deoxycytidylate deaminase